MEKTLRLICFFSISLFLLHGDFSFAETGSIYIASKPSGAEISLDGNPINKKTDLFIENLPTGSHKVLVDLPSYGRAERRIEIKEDLTTVVHFDLQTKEIVKETMKEIKNTASYESRGFSYFAKDQYDLAIADFTKAIDLDPNLLAAYYNRGVAYFDKGQYDLATTDFTKAKDLGLKGKGAYNIRRLV